jgi:O-antigen ligase
MITSPAAPVSAAGRSALVREHVAGAALLLYLAALPWAIAPISIAAAIFGVATVAAWTARAPRDLAPVWMAGLAWFAAHLAAAAFAIDPAASFARTPKGLMPLIVLAVGDVARRHNRLGRAVAVLLVSAGLSAIFGLTLYVVHGGGAVGRARGAVGHYMTFGGQLMLVGCLAAGLLLAGVPGRVRAGLAAMLAVAGAALAATFTRSAWLGVCSGVGVMLGVRRPRALPLLIGAVAVLLAVAPGSFRARALSAFDPHHPTNRERTYMWGAGLRMFRDHPMTGVGLEDLKPVYDRYRPAAATERAGHLHSVPIQIAATMGLPGLVAFAWLVFALFRVPLTGGLRTLRTRGLSAGVRLGVLAGLTGFLVAGLFEWNAGDEELLHLLFALVGLAWAARPLPAAEPAPESRADAPTVAGGAT